MLNPADKYQDLRSALRELCAQFPAEYFRRIDERRAYPEEFVDALTKAGWLAALIPEEYGGSGLGLTEASVRPRPEPPYSSGINAASHPGLVSASTNSSG